MKASSRLLPVVLFCAVISSSRVFADSSENALQGSWQFIAMELNGTVYPPRDPRLKLLYEFDSTQQSRLYWSYTEGSSFCERRGQYDTRSGELIDIVTWVNPQNDSSCSLDTDMQLGHESISHFELRMDEDDTPELKIYIPFGNDDMIYIWKKLPTRASAAK